MLTWTQRHRAHRHTYADLLREKDPTFTGTDEEAQVILVERIARSCDRSRAREEVRRAVADDAARNG